MGGLVFTDWLYARIKGATPAWSLFSRASLRSTVPHDCMRLPQIPRLVTGHSLPYVIAREPFFRCAWGEVEEPLSPCTDLGFGSRAPNYCASKRLHPRVDDKGGVIRKWHLLIVFLMYRHYWVCTVFISTTLFMSHGISIRRQIDLL